LREKFFFFGVFGFFGVDEFSSRFFFWGGVMIELSRTNLSLSLDAR